MTYKALQAHLEGLDIKSMEDWRNTNSFSCFASSSGLHGGVQLGTDGTGGWCVKYIDGGDITQYFKNPQDALDRYIELITK